MVLHFQIADINSSTGHSSGASGKEFAYMSFLMCVHTPDHDQKLLNKNYGDQMVFDITRVFSCFGFSFPVMSNFDGLVDGPLTLFI